MQENENQPEPETPPPSESEPDAGQPEPEPQPLSESEPDAGQPEPASEEQQSQPGPQIQPPPATGPQPATPIPLPPTRQQKQRQYFWSLGFGLIPVIVLLVTFGIGTQQGESGLGLLILGALLAVLLYIIELIVMIVFLANARQRFVGYGLLTAFLVTPIVTAVGCTVIPKLIHP